MANVIIPNQERKESAERIMRQFGVDKRDPAMREAAEITAVRQQEAIDRQKNTRRYFV